jgi:RimJ/RimL family protein N-acetyltransferase
MPRLDTQRLLLRPWRTADREPFAAMNADPAVMEFFPAPLAREASDAMIDGFTHGIDERGWGNWAVEVRETGDFIGFIGLSIPKRNYPFSPCVEIGWRLARAHWARGYATEGARETLRFGFEQAGLEEVVSFTSILNTRSRKVMERIGMRDAHEDFEHPALPEGHKLRPHCLYRLHREDWHDR